MINLHIELNSVAVVFNLLSKAGYQFALDLVGAPHSLKVNNPRATPLKNHFISYQSKDMLCSATNSNL